MAKIEKIQLVTVTANVGRGANDGVYPPVGLLTIAKAVLQDCPHVAIQIDDQHHAPIEIDPEAQVVGIQVASTLCYKNALAVAQAAKAADKIVVLGGPHVTTLYRQVMSNREYVDFAIRGKGERPFVQLLQALGTNGVSMEIPALSWRRGQEIIHNPGSILDWDYDDYTPLPLATLSSGIASYWEAFRITINLEIDAAFLLFTHFGCGYRERRTHGEQIVLGKSGQPLFCSFCSLHDPPLTRPVQSILEELRFYLDFCQLPFGSRVHLKCYGDNIGPQIELVRELAVAIRRCAWWCDYRFSWTFYCQSSYLNEELASLLSQIGTTHLYIGFDGANDAVQKRNALGTSRRTHEQAVSLCLKRGIKIQAGSVVGLAGETPTTLEEMYQFLRGLAERGVLERVNSAVLFIIPGTAAYEMLCQKEPQIRPLDLLPTTELRGLWIKHFCPAVTPELLREYAAKIDALSPGPHAQMGYQA